MAEKTQGVNLLPSLTRKELREEQQKGQLVLGVTAITFVIALITAVLFFYNLYLEYSVKGTPFDFLKITGIDNQIGDINEQIDSQINTFTTYTEVSAKLNFIDEILSSKPNYQEILDQLQDFLPDDIEINNYQIDESGVIVLTGVSKDYYTIALLINRAQAGDSTTKIPFGHFNLVSAEKIYDDKVSFTVTALAESVEGQSVVSDEE